MSHLESAAENWRRYSRIEQMAHIGSEVSRTLLARGMQKRYWGAICRALDLFYLTVEDPKWKGHLKELLRVRELFCAAVLGSTEYHTSLEDLDKYFYYFALLVQQNKAKSLGSC